MRVADDSLIRARWWKPNARRDQGSLALDGLDDERVADAFSFHCRCCGPVARIPWDIGDDIPSRHDISSGTFKYCHWLTVIGMIFDFYCGLG